MKPLLQRFITLTQLRVSQRTLEERLSWGKPIESLADLVRLFDEWQVATQALVIHPYQLVEIPVPAFVPYTLPGGGADFVLIEQVKDEKVTFWANGIPRTESFDAFSEQWDGTILLAEVDEQSGEADYKAKKEAALVQNIALVLLVVMVLIGLGSSVEQPSFTGLLWRITKGAGLLLSAFLLQHTYGGLPAAVGRLCHLTTKTSCDAVLRSKGATLYGGVSLAELSAFYFTFSGLLYWLVPDPTAVALVSSLALLVVPVTIFSLWYQARVVRQWCVLCLGVVGVLWGESLLALNQTHTLAWEDLWAYRTDVSISFGLPLLAWYVIKPLVRKLTQYTSDRYRLAQFERHPGVFLLSMVRQEPKYVETWTEEITAGPADSPVTITLVTNPLCGPCVKAHRRISQYAAHFDIRVNYRLAPDFENPDSERNTIIRHLYSLPPELRAEALHDWYEQRDYTRWANRYPVVFTKEAQRMVDWSAAWCEIVQIEHTPTVLINGLALPEPYQIETLPMHLRDIMEYVQPAPA